MKKLLKPLVFAVLCMLALAGCVKPPQAPSWETELNIPLMNKTYTAIDLADSTDFVVENDTLFFLQTGDVESVELGEQMNINAHGDAYPWLPLPAQETISASFNIDEEGYQDEDIAVSYATIEEWVIQIGFQQVDPALQQVSLTFEDIYTPAGQPVSVNITDFGTATLLDLGPQGGQYYSIGQPGNTALYDSLAVTVQTQSAAGAPASVGQMKIFFDGHCYFHEMHGMVYNKLLPVNDYDVDIDIDYPSGADSAIVVSPNGPRIEVTIWNQLGFPVELRGKLIASNDEGQTRSLVFDATDHMVFDAATSMYDSTATTQTMRDSVGWLLNIFPTRIELVDAWFIVGRTQGEYGFAYSGADARGDFTGKLPFLFRLTGEPMFIPEPETSEISSSNRDQIEKYAQGGEIVFRLDNAFPAGAMVDLYLSTSSDEDSLYQQPMLHFPREGDNSYVPASQPDSLRFGLSQEDILFFTNPSINLGMKFTFDATDGDVYVAPTDYLGLVGRSRITLFIDNE